MLRNQWSAVSGQWSAFSSIPLVVRYGAGYINPGYEVEDEGEPFPNAPYAFPPISMVLI
ncbi:MAG: hypothetical protein F6J94_27115 [Moorea sp. SIO1F2]|uniref:hypothetical protein n=1 Tax=Moorena sp. SIO1F2 TaxID=2607819 RepID=UPI0013BD6590|nr:hypothetical protein [Moorena sp. SIO1F2]NEO23470.1 hypothetical protein [Moorena sp. SIO4A5]NEQ57149.1 hypothetical protein [Moorena sp. SIO4A1]NET85439.1 hypothetical protein [Moorena sp. SIO1F2]